jgi:ASC-1-like (ASCH) protein
MSTTYTLPFLEADRTTFEFIQHGIKKIETRAGSPEYLKIKEGDTLVFTCGEDSVTRTVKKVSHAESEEHLFFMFKTEQINPQALSYDELRQKYASFPGYPERIKEYGILAFHLG